MDQTYWNDQIKKGSQERESHLVGYARISFLFFMFLYAAAQTTPGLRAPFQVSSLKKKKKKKERKKPKLLLFPLVFLVYIYTYSVFLSLSLLLFSPSCNSSTREVARPPFVTLLDSHRFHLNFKGASSRVTIEMLFTHRDENRPPLMDL